MNRTHLDQSGSISSRNHRESPSFIRGAGLWGMGRIGVFAVICCLLPTSAGCLHLPVRHGMILKGDWSLEMNRIPWLKGRDNAYQDPSGCEPGPSMCAAEIDSPFATAASSPTPAMAGYRAANCGPAGCGPTGHGQSAMAPQPHARFHAVPTGSAFSATPNFSPMMNVPISPPSLPPVKSAPEPLRPSPLPTESQTIPTPRPISPEVPNSQAAVARKEASQQVSWIFNPATVADDSAPRSD